MALLPRHILATASALALALAAAQAHAEAPGGVPAGTSSAATVASEPRPSEPDIGKWLMRMHEASRRRAYVGVFVVSAGANMSSARIWHVCDGDQQIERVETLTGKPRSTFRHNDEVITFLPESKTALAERRESLGLFPDLLKSASASIGRFYAAQKMGVERVAGVDAELVLLKPKDHWRYGYRVWSEKKSGLVVKLQTLDVDGSLIEQAAFSELQLDAPVSMGKLTQMMGNTQGYRVERQELVKTTPEAEGWMLKTRVAGFEPMSCNMRPLAGGEAGATPRATMQWVFSDGLASVSVFAEPFDPQRHAREGVTSMGATRMLMRRLTEKSGDWWLTVVGEVPTTTLSVFAQSLVRTR